MVAASCDGTSSLGRLLAVNSSNVLGFRVRHHTIRVNGSNC